MLPLANLHLVMSIVGELHPNPGVPTQSPGAAFAGHWISCPLEVPSNLVFGDAFIGRSTPNTIIPVIVRTLITVSQYSISPYRRTLKLLKSKGMTRNIVIQISGGYLSLGSQNAIMFAAATSCAGRPIT